MLGISIERSHIPTTGAVRVLSINYQAWFNLRGIHSCMIVETGRGDSTARSLRIIELIKGLIRRWTLHVCRHFPMFPQIGDASIAH